MPSKKQINVKVRTRDEVMFEGPAKSVSSTNDKGKFDILALHANFISLINEKIEIISPGGQKQEFQIDSGIVRVVSDVVEIFVGVKQALKEKV
jgi:F0F1-type ATP synthase epsilon subunit